ncbi:MAG TPA: hypothetical protein VNB29_10195 [Chthoniobacterales bacterium]|jgi:hypothetical protein|nr:hypothetical protein [Chthoniobacterales bacterium]
MSSSILPDLQASLLCEDVRAEISGQQTLIGVITVIPAPMLPVAFFKLCLWTRWCGGEGTFTQRSLIISSEDEQILAESRVEFTLNELEGNATNVHVFGGVKFERFGIHHIEIHLDDELQLRFPLPVIKVGQQG